MKYKCIVGYKGREGVLSDHEVAFHIILKEEKKTENEREKKERQKEGERQIWKKSER